LSLYALPTFIAHHQPGSEDRNGIETSLASLSPFTPPSHSGQTYLSSMQLSCSASMARETTEATPLPHPCLHISLTEAPVQQEALTRHRAKRPTLPQPNPCTCICARCRSSVVCISVCTCMRRRMCVCGGEQRRNGAAVRCERKHCMCDNWCRGQGSRSALCARAIKIFGAAPPDPALLATYPVNPRLATWNPSLHPEPRALPVPHSKKSLDPTSHTLHPHARAHTPAQGLRCPGHHLLSVLLQVHIHLHHAILQPMAPRRAHAPEHLTRRLLAKRTCRPREEQGGAAVGMAGSGVCAAEKVARGAGDIA